MEWLNILLVSSFTAVLASPLVNEVLTTSVALSCASSLISLITLGFNLAIMCILFKMKDTFKEAKVEEAMDFTKFRTNDVPKTEDIISDTHEIIYENDDESEYEYETDDEEVTPLEPPHVENDQVICSSVESTVLT